MNIDYVNSLCKQSTRKAFDEFKNQIEVRLFPFNNDLKENLQLQMLEQISMSIIKTIYKNNDITSAQSKVLKSIIDNYKTIALKTSENYSKRFL